MDCSICQDTLNGSEYAKIKRNNEPYKYHPICLKKWFQYSNKGVISRDSVKSYYIYTKEDKLLKKEKVQYKKSDYVDPQILTYLNNLLDNEELNDEPNMEQFINYLLEYVNNPHIWTVLRNLFNNRIDYSEYPSSSSEYSSSSSEYSSSSSEQDEYIISINTDSGDSNNSSDSSDSNNSNDSSDSNNSNDSSYSNNSSDSSDSSDSDKSKTSCFHNISEKFYLSLIIFVSILLLFVILYVTNTINDMEIFLMMSGIVAAIMLTVGTLDYIINRYCDI